MLSIMRDPDFGFVRLFTPFDKAFVDELKGLVPPGAREAVYTMRLGRQRFDYWRVRSQYLQPVVDLMEHVWPGEDILSDLQTGSAATTSDAVGWVRACWNACPLQHRKKLYRSLAQVFHPDVGGSVEVMRALNALEGG